MARSKGKRRNKGSKKINTTPRKSKTIAEPKLLFFVDNKPSTYFTPPIYDIDTEVKPNEIMSQVRNFRISGSVSFTNKENQNRVTHEPIFAPDPMLSSTRLNDSLDENEHILGNHNVTMPPAIQISINSSCESGATRKVTVDRASPKSSIPKMIITTKNHVNTNTSDNNSSSSSITNNNGIVIKTITNTAKPVVTLRATKRKADNNSSNVEPPKKKNVSDVIVLDDTILDVEKVDDDSVVFVSETMVSPTLRQTFACSSKKKAANYISINGNSSKAQSPRSTRAQRRSEKKRLKRERTAQAKHQKQNTKFKKPNPSPKKKNRSRVKSNIPIERNRFDSNGASTSYLSSPSSSSTRNDPGTSTTTENQTQPEPAQKVIIGRELQEKLFKEKPELFEKRMIIIDGSNVAHSHGLQNRTYSIKGIELCVKHFENLGFPVKAVVPQMRQKRSRSSDPDALEKMINAGKIILTPCKNIPGKWSTCYDDRFILDSAVLNNGAIISNDNFADLLKEKDTWDKIIGERVVGFSWCDDFFMVPDDPYGKNGPSLQFILHKLKENANVEDADTSVTESSNDTENEPSVIICEN